MLLLGDALLRAGIVSLLLLAPWVLLLLWGVYVAVFASSVATDDDGITVQNFLRRTRIPWAAVEDIVLRFQLIVVTKDGRRVTCYGGPVSARPATPRRRGRGDDGPRPPAGLRDLEGIRALWEDAVARGAGDGEVRRGWDVPALIALAVLVAAAIIATISVSASA